MRRLFDVAKKEILTEALHNAQGSISQAARNLGTSRTYLYRLMNELGITTVNQTKYGKKGDWGSLSNGAGN